MTSKNTVSLPQTTVEIQRNYGATFPDTVH